MLRGARSLCDFAEKRYWLTKMIDLLPLILALWRRVRICK